MERGLHWDGLQNSNSCESVLKLCPKNIDNPVLLSPDWVMSATLHVNNIRHEREGQGSHAVPLTLALLCPCFPDRDVSCGVAITIHNIALGLYAFKKDVSEGYFFSTTPMSKLGCLNSTGNNLRSLNITRGAFGGSAGRAWTQGNATRSFRNLLREPSVVEARSR